jgi:hypothetical protein
VIDSLKGELSFSDIIILISIDLIMSKIRLIIGGALLFWSCTASLCASLSRSPTPVLDQIVFGD